MADGDPPPEGSPARAAAAAGILSSLSSIDWDQIQRNMTRVGQGYSQGMLGKGVATPPPQALPAEAKRQKEDFEPARAGGEVKKSTRRASKRTSLDRIPGRRPMNEYPVTGEELLTLGIMQGATALLLAAAGTCFGFYLSTKQTIDFAGKEVSRAIVGWWSGMGDAAFYLAVVTLILGLALGAPSSMKVSRIMRNTDHE
jgi:hypothetical protein